MKVTERCTQKIRDGKFDAAAAIEKKWDAFEAKLGHVPPKRRCIEALNNQPGMTFVWERDWDSMAAYETYVAAILMSPEQAALTKESGAVYEDARFSILWIWEL